VSTVAEGNGIRASHGDSSGTVVVEARGESGDSGHNLGVGAHNSVGTGNANNAGKMSDGTSHGARAQASKLANTRLPLSAPGSALGAVAKACIAVSILSLVTFHSSLVTCHVSFVPCHLSRFIRHLSIVTCHSPLCIRM
jgi:hypothetical protein